METMLGKLGCQLLTSSSLFFRFSKKYHLYHLYCHFLISYVSSYPYKTNEVSNLRYFLRCMCQPVRQTTGYLQPWCPDMCQALPSLTRIWERDVWSKVCSLDEEQNVQTSLKWLTVAIFLQLQFWDRRYTARDTNKTQCFKQSWA